MIEIVKVDGVAEEQLLNKLKSRSKAEDARVTQIVLDILAKVQEKGDEALADFTKKFDGVFAEKLEVSKDEIQSATRNADSGFVYALLKAKENIMAFHTKQKQPSFIDAQENGIMVGQKVRGLERVGIYVPGGTASYPSSVLMNSIPAKIAGVKQIIMVTPPDKDGKANKDILAAANIAEVDRIFLVGGAQAIAALAYGTSSIPKVDKIVGPGNIYVATAKRLLYGTVDIDMVAGPSEILVLADKTAEPKYLAADLMSQAEHDRLASAILITDSQRIADETKKEIELQIKTLSRSEIIADSLANYGAILVCQPGNIKKMIELANRIAPEHLEVMLENPIQYLGCLENAGSIFLGKYSPEPLGDYYAGPNHVLPTSGTARFFSPLGVDSFTKRSSFVYYTKEELEKAKPHIQAIAQKEGLSAHANSVQVRFDEGGRGKF